MARPVRSINASTLVQGRRVVLPLLLAVAAAALVALLLSRRITRPVRELTAASERIARGDYDVHLDARRAPTSSASSRCASSRWRGS